MAKLADAPDLGSGGAILRGSSPLPGNSTTKSARYFFAEDQSSAGGSDSAIVQWTDSAAREHNWQSSSNAKEIIATGIPPVAPNESAILIRLEPGNYTAVVQGPSDGTGIAVTEVYEINRE